MQLGHESDGSFLLFPLLFKGRGINRGEALLLLFLRCAACFLVDLWQFRRGTAFLPQTQRFQQPVLSRVASYRIDFI